MLLFFQFDLPSDADAQLGASHLCVFMCPIHNEIPSFEQHERLPAEFWDKTEGHFHAVLGSTAAEQTIESPRLLLGQSLTFSETADESREYIATGGNPSWIQNPERFACSCGAEMHFVCQVSENYKFIRLAEAPEQPDTPYKDGYVLFLGNEIYVFACPARCDPRAVWITVQN